MAEPREAASSSQPPGTWHASGAASGGSASVDRYRHSLGSSGGSSMASGTTHVEATGPGSDAGSRLSSASPTPQARRDPESARTARTAALRGTHRHNKSSGAFLLNDALSGTRPGHDTAHAKPVQSSTRSSGRERHRSDGNGCRSGGLLSASVTPEKRHRGSSAEPAPEGKRLQDTFGASGSTVLPMSAEALADDATAATLPSPPSSARSPSPAVPNQAQALDIDSAQIVNMALNLSESRRLVSSRRSASQNLAPRLAPLSDSAVGGNLLRQLQQQRRISRTISPRPDKGPGGRAVSGQVANANANVNANASASPRVSSSSGMQPVFDPLGDGGSAAYRYHFSKSTLARAQKAKDYLELLAQQRRLLEFIPPLAPDASTQTRSTSLTSPPTSSSNSSHPYLGTGSGSGDFVSNAARVGRPYNPLQYIRNRKARVRERKIIDGEAQGFGDVPKVAGWVDEVARWAATGQNRIPGGPTLPNFATADALTAALQSSPPVGLGSRAAGQGVMTKPKRPRLDWAIDPADMLADVYWVEQGDNRLLVQDRQWRRIFPQDPNLYRPASQRAVGQGNMLNMPDPTGGAPTGFAPTGFLDISTGPLHRTPELAAAEYDHGSTRTRTRQKLSPFRLHYRHSSRQRRGSFSDTSDSDSDRGLFRRRAKDVSVAAASSETEGRERDALPSGPPATGSSPANGNAQSTQATPAKVEVPSRKPAAVDNSVRSSRASLEIPVVSRRRSSLDYDSSLPASPEQRPLSSSGGIGLVPVSGGDLSSPPSRAATPPPPPSRFSKVKHMFRDHSHERGRERTNSAGFAGGSQERDDLMSASINYNQLQSPPQQHEAAAAAEIHSAPMTTTPSIVGDASKLLASHDSKDPLSPMRKGLSRTNTATMDSHKSHSSLTSIASLRHAGHVSTFGSHSQSQHRSEESAAAASSSSSSTLRGIFKGGPRIDTMLRSGVSKVSDMFWRRDSSDASYDGAGGGAGGGTGDAASSASSDDDSDGEGVFRRGRVRKTPRHSRSPSRNAGLHMSKSGEKHYLDVMPTFGSHQLTLTPDPVSRPPSRHSTRFELLKPPPITVHDATPTTEIPEVRLQTDVDGVRDSDSSDADRSRRRSDAATTYAGGFANADRPRWSISQPAYGSHGGALSRRELARLRASLYSSAMLAKELSQRAHQPLVLGGDDYDNDKYRLIATGDGERLTWPDIVVYGQNPAELARRPVRHVELYPLAAQVLGGAIQRSAQSWQTSAEYFSDKTVPALHARVDRLRERVAVELSGLARKAADEADAATQDLVAVQRLQVVQVEDRIEQMLRRRRRRFRWVRRAGWLTVEWLLVGFMWWAWLVVMMARVVMGTCGGIVAGVRWLLWM